VVYFCTALYSIPLLYYNAIRCMSYAINNNDSITGSYFLIRRCPLSTEIVSNTFSSGFFFFLVRDEFNSACGDL
jgi:hypothetical protein